MLKGLAAVFFSSAATLFFGITGVFLSLFAPGYVIRLAVRPWGRAVLFCCGVSFEIRGVENIPSEPSVIMYNHQSSLDIPALVASLPGEYKLVMKDEVLRIPFVGWVSKMTGHYFVPRDGGSGDSRQLKFMARGIRKEKHTIVLAPEGTRSESGRLLDFKKGGFLLASLSGSPVVPMIIWGGKNVKRKTDRILKTGEKMSVEFLPPVYPAQFPGGKEGREEIEGLVRDAMLKKVDERLRDEVSAQ